MDNRHPVHRHLRQVRWVLLDERDRLKSQGPMTFGRWVADWWLGLIIYLLSLPIYLTSSPQTAFERYARRHEKTYVDSYTRFKQAVQFTVGLALLSIVAVTLAVVLATVVRTKLFG